MENSQSYIGLRSLTLAVMVLLLSIGHLQQSEATCDPVQLSWCLQSIVSNLPPTAECCQKLKSQEACLCQEMSNPTFGAYLRLAGAKMVCGACDVAYPNC